MTLYLLVISHGPNNALVFGNFGLVVVSAVRFRSRIVPFTTALCALAYLGVWSAAYWLLSKVEVSPYQIVPFVTILLVIGLGQTLLLRRIVRVNRLIAADR